MISNNLFLFSYFLRLSTYIFIFLSYSDSSINLLKFFVFRSLQWLRGPHKNVDVELDTIRSNIRTSRLNIDNNINSNLSSISHNGLPMKYSFKTIVSNVKSVLRNARLIKPVMITCGLMVFQRFTGKLILIILI